MNTATLDAIDTTDCLVHFSWMGSYWSCSSEVWDHLQQRVEVLTAFDLYTLKVRELHSRPKGPCPKLDDVSTRTATK